MTLPCGVRISSADLAGNAAGFLFEGTSGEFGAGGTVANIFSNARFEIVSSFILSDVHKLVQE